MLDETESNVLFKSIFYIVLDFLVIFKSDAAHGFPECVGHLSRGDIYNS